MGHKRPRWPGLAADDGRVRIHAGPWPCCEFAVDLFPVEVPYACNLWMYHASNPLAWQHLAKVTSVDAKRGLVAVVPTLSPSWKHLEGSCDRILPMLRDALEDEKKYQRAVSRLLKPELHPSRWAEYLSERLKAFCCRNELPSNSLDLIDKFECGSWAECLKTMSPFAVSHILRTCFNSWITSFRIINGSNRFKCLFCGNGFANLGHYLVCEKLWGHMHDLTGICFDGPIMHRLGISTDKRILSCVGFVSYLYHAIRVNPTTCDRLEFHLKAFNFAAKACIPIRSHCDRPSCVPLCKLGQRLAAPEAASERLGPLAMPRAEHPGFSAHREAPVSHSDLSPSLDNCIAAASVAILAQAI